MYLATRYGICSAALEVLMQGYGGWVNVVMQNAVICLFKSVETLTGAHALTFSVYAVDASYCGSASFWVIRCHFLGVS